MASPCPCPTLRCSLRVGGRCYGTQGDIKKCGGQVEEVAEEVPLQQCSFNIAWVGQCKKQGRPYCDKHAKVKCHNCGKQATHECSVAGQFVCGYPYCDDCKCTMHGR